MGIGQAQPANFSAVSVYFNAFDFGGIDADYCTAAAEKICTACTRGMETADCF